MRCYSWKTKAKLKEKRLKVAIENSSITYTGRPVRRMADYSIETFEVRRGRKDVFQSLRDHNFQPEIIESAKPSFIHEGKMKTFHDKNKLKEFSTTIEDSGRNSSDWKTKTKQNTRHSKKKNQHKEK